MRWAEVEVLVNPNGPLSDAGSRKDNGQTGRKLVMDYYGPRVPLGGGAIYGKDPMHVDRFGARQAREMAIDAVKQGAGECLVRAVYAPNLAEPLDVQVEVKRGDARVNAQRLRLPQSSPRAPFREFAGGECLNRHDCLHLVGIQGEPVHAQEDVNDGECDTFVAIGKAVPARQREVIRGRELRQGRGVLA